MLTVREFHLEKATGSTCNDYITIHDKQETSNGEKILDKICGTGLVAKSQILNTSHYIKLTFIADGNKKEKRFCFTLEQVEPDDKKLIVLQKKILSLFFLKLRLCKPIVVEVG